MHPLTLERMLLWTIIFTRHIEARAGDKVHALRPQVEGDKAFLSVSCRPEDLLFFLLVTRDISPLPVATSVVPDPDRAGWETILIPLPGT